MHATDRIPLVNAPAEKNIHELTIKLMQLSLSDHTQSEIALALQQYERDHSEDAYLNNPSVIEAQNYVETQLKTRTQLLQESFRAHHHPLSSIEKSLLLLGSFSLIVGLVLIHEVYVILIDGKPCLEETGFALGSHCNPMLSPAQHFAESCALLNETHNTAVLNFNKDVKHAPVPAFIGNGINVTSLPGNQLHTVPSWFRPVGWRDFAVCQRIGDNISFVGHAFHGALDDAKRYAKDGFPIFTQLKTLIPEAASPHKTQIENFIKICLPLFCMSLAKRSYSDEKQFYTQGFERFANTFEKNADIFTIIYGTLMGLTVLMMLTIGVKKLFDFKATANHRFNTQHSMQRISDLFQLIQTNANEADPLVVTHPPRSTPV